eukprot:1563239-Rhodomonas_salina.1
MPEEPVAPAPIDEEKRLRQRLDLAKAQKDKGTPARGHNQDQRRAHESRCHRQRAASHAGNISRVVLDVAMSGADVASATIRLASPTKRLLSPALRTTKLSSRLAPR